MSNKKPTQVEKIIRYMVEFGSISTLEAFTELGVVRLGARISEMRKSGLNIIGKVEHGKNRFKENVCYMRYYFAEGGNDLSQSVGCSPRK